MYGDEIKLRKLRTPHGWFLCQQLDDLQCVCEHFYRQSGVRYTVDFLVEEQLLPFLIRDAPTEDRAWRVIQVIEFPQAQHVVSYDRERRPSPFFWKRPKNPLPDWIWDKPPWPHRDEEGNRQVCIGSTAYFCATPDDQPMIDAWLALDRENFRFMHADGFDDTPMPYLIKMTYVPKDRYAILTAVPTDDLILLVEQWKLFFGARDLALRGGWERFNARMRLFLDNVVHTRWPINHEHAER